MIPEADLRADCSACAGLCCVAHTLTKGPDFPVAKPAGTPCTNLAEDFGCRIHTRLRADGWNGCVAYDCFGAGQVTVRDLFGGATWREVGPRQFEVFSLASRLHELLWYATRDLARPEAAAVHADLRRAVGRLVRLRDGLADGAPADPEAEQARLAPLLIAASAAVRAGARPDAPDRSRADLAGRDLRRADLRAADLRGAVLIGADLRGVDLGPADLLGADLRGARLEAADLSWTLHLTRSQVGAATLDAASRLPSDLA